MAAEYAGWHTLQTDPVISRNNSTATIIAHTNDRSASGMGIPVSHFSHGNPIGVGTETV